MCGSLTVKQTAEEQAIRATLAYFDLFDYPLTFFEIWKYLYWPSGGKTDASISIEAVIDALQALKARGEIEERFGFYSYPGRLTIRKTRMSRYRIAERKYRSVRWVIRVLRGVPYIRSVFVCNNLGYSNSPAASDIDVFIIIQSGRLWLSRLMTLILVNTLGRRRHGIKVENRICLSFFATERSLDLSSIALREGDIYLTYWLATLTPVFGAHWYPRVLECNQWLESIIPNFHAPRPSNRRYIYPGVPGLSATFFERILSLRIFDAIERVLARWQKRRLVNFFGDVSSYHNFEIVLSDDMIKLHKTDRRRQYADLWSARLS